MLEHNTSLCPGHEDMPVDELIALMRYEDFKYQLERVFLNGAAPLERELNRLGGLFQVGLRQLPIADDLSAVVGPNRLAELVDLQPTSDTEPSSNPGGTIHVQFVAMESLAQSLKRVLESVLEFIRSLVKRVVAFFKFLFDRSDANLKTAQSHVRTMRQAVQREPTIVRSIGDMQITPSVPYEDYQRLMKRATAVQEHLLTVDIGQAEADIRLTMDTPKDKTPPPVHFALTNRFLSEQFLAECADLGLMINPKKKSERVPQEDAVAADVTYRSTLRKIMADTRPSTLKQLGYTPEIIEQLTNQHASHLNGLKAKTAANIERLEKIQTLFEELEKKNFPSSRFKNVNSGDPDLDFHGNYMVFGHYRQVIHLCSQLGTFMSLFCKINIITEELLAYNRNLAAAAAKAVSGSK